MIFKCKMCGAQLDIEEGQTIAECDYCGTKQTLPKLDDERRANLYDRANHFRRNNEFDKAMGIYESILNEDKTDAEAYWSLVICRYGIEYVEDPSSHKRIPTVNRAQYTSIFADEDYKSAIENADALQKTIYEDEAKQIDEIQKGILEISQKEEPFDVFICYKETDADGRRTVDSVRATELYHELTKEGFKVFFSRITLEDKLGTAYEPYIFAALNSAKVMVVLGTKPEHFNAVWVKNEWSRYLSLIKSGAKKTLIPAYQDMDPYDLPEEFSHLQALDMAKLGFMQDLIRGIKKITATDEHKAVVKETVVVNNANSNANVVALKKRGFMALEDGEWQKADDFFEEALNQDAEDAECYLGKLMAELKVKTKDSLKDIAEPFDDKSNCIKASKFSGELAKKIKADNKFIRDRNETARKQGIYDNAQGIMRNAKSEDEFKSAASKFGTIAGFKDADEQKKACLDKAEIARKDAIYVSALSEIDKGQDNYSKISHIESAIKIFESVIDWKDSRTKIDECNRKIEDIKIANEKAEAERKRKAEEARIAAEKAKAKRKKILSIAIPGACVVIAFVIVLNTVIIPKNKLKKAMAELDAGNYDSAYSMLAELEESDTINSSKYDRAVELVKSGKTAAAAKLFCQISSYKDSAEKLNGLIKEDSSLAIYAVNEGEYFTFGTYEQDNDSDNGKEAIEWLVLDKQDNKMLVISKYALDSVQYNEEYENTTWETCTLRTWLNGTFYKAAFSSEEQKMIQSAKVTADANPSYSTDPGNDTTDKVFLLSITEAEKYFSSDVVMICKPTYYAVANGAFVYDSTGGCVWWLRSPGYRSDNAAGVNTTGGVYYYGSSVNSDYDCVRPALWIEIY